VRPTPGDPLCATTLYKARSGCSDQPFSGCPARVAQFDHIRRNSSSIASDGTQILAALGVLARGLLASLALLNAPADGSCTVEVAVVMVEPLRLVAGSRCRSTRVARRS